MDILTIALLAAVAVAILGAVISAFVNAIVGAAVFGVAALVVADGRDVQRHNAVNEASIGQPTQPARAAGHLEHLAGQHAPALACPVDERDEGEADGANGAAHLLEPAAEDRLEPGSHQPPRLMFPASPLHVFHNEQNTCACCKTNKIRNSEMDAF